MARTFALLAAMTALFGVVGYLLGGQQGILIALAIAAATNIFAYWNSDKMVLRMQGARPVDASQAPDLHRMTADLAQNAGLPMPALYVIDTDQPNAFATGRNPANAAVAVTRGLLRHMNREQVAGVIAHELAHIKNRDTLLMTVTATLAGAISMLANFAMFFGGRDRQMNIVAVLALAILSPLAAAVVQGAISRTREYEADAEGARICRHPDWLASALEVLGRLSGRIDNPRAERSPATAHMFIVNPLHMHAHDSLFSTHPPVQQRIARLRDMAMPAGESPPRQEPRRRVTAARPGPWGRSDNRQRGHARR